MEENYARMKTKNIIDFSTTLTHWQVHDRPRAHHVNPPMLEEPWSLALVGLRAGLADPQFNGELSGRSVTLQEIFNKS